MSTQTNPTPLHDYVLCEARQKPSDIVLPDGTLEGDVTITVLAIGAAVKADVQPGHVVLLRPNANTLGVAKRPDGSFTFLTNESSLLARL